MGDFFSFPLSRLLFLKVSKRMRTKDVRARLRSYEVIREINIVLWQLNDGADVQKFGHAYFSLVDAFSVKRCAGNRHSCGFFLVNKFRF